MTPRLATEHEAAGATGLDVSTFRAWVASGRLPKPIVDCGKFDMKAIDAAIDRISGLGSPTNALDAWRAKAEANARQA
jgi:predicted site-specific integrase-resolvase